MIGRSVTTSPNEGERYFLRLSLSHVCGPTSLDYLLTVNGQREATLRLDLLEFDNYIEKTLEETVAFEMP